LEALADTRLTADEVSGIHIRTHPRWMSVCNIEEPKTGLAAKFSYVQTAAMTLLGHDTGAVGSFTDAICKDVDVLALRAKMRVSEDNRLSETQAEVSITLAGGALQRVKHDLLDEVTLEARAQKLGAKAVSLLGDARADALWQAAQGDALRDLMVQLNTS